MSTTSVSYCRIARPIFYVDDNHSPLTTLITGNTAFPHHVELLFKMASDKIVPGLYGLFSQRATQLFLLKPGQYII